jgi:fructose-1,6-bisphosphatase
MYECNPLGMLVEQAGGRASTGYEPLLQIQPTSRHQRVPFVCGSSEDVEEAMQFMAEDLEHIEASAATA